MKEENFIPSFFDFTPVDSVEGYKNDSSQQFDEDTDDSYKSISVGGKNYEYITFGAGDDLPYSIIELIGKNQVMSQNKLFNVVTCYGNGLIYADRKTHQATEDADILDFFDHNPMAKFQLEQSTDMKYFFFAVSVIILNRKGDKIISLRHREACHVRFEKSKNGIINNILYANWRKAVPKDIEVIPLLDEDDPLGDLRCRLGLIPNSHGQKQKPTHDRKFAIVTRFPTPGYQYYPIPYYTSIFRDDWYDIYSLIGKGKKTKMKNHTSLRYHVEINTEYWSQLFFNEGITTPEAKKARVEKEKTNIKKFIAGNDNQDKLLVSEFSLDATGAEKHMIKINVVDTSKEGGDWSEDMQEASNMTCYGDNIHPNLVGATPGKSQSNNSGSDKRELFTLKQSIEKPFHDIMATPHKVVIGFNGWSKMVYPDVPIITLTTLDENKDAKKQTLNNNNDGNSEDNQG